MTGTGTVDLAAKSLALRVEPKLVMTTEGQGRASDPVGLGIPVVIDGPWSEPRIYPEMAGIWTSRCAYAQLKEMGKGLFARRGLSNALSGLGGSGGTGFGRQRNPSRARAPGILLKRFCAAAASPDRSRRIIGGSWRRRGRPSCAGSPARE